MITAISSIHDPRVAVFATMTETQLRNRLNAEQGLFIAESPKVIRVALQAGYKVEFYFHHEEYGDGRDLADQLAMQIDQLGETLCETDLEKLVESIRKLRKE